MTKIDLSTKAGQRIWDAGALSGGLDADVVTPLTVTVPIDNADPSKGEATITLSYSRQGLVQFARAMRSGEELDPSHFITEWDLQDVDGSPLSRDAHIPTRLFDAMVDAIERDARKRWPWLTDWV